MFKASRSDPPDLNSYSRSDPGDLGPLMCVPRVSSGVSSSGAMTGFAICRLLNCGDIRSGGLDDIVLERR